MHLVNQLSEEYELERDARERHQRRSEQLEGQVQFHQADAERWRAAYSNSLIQRHELSKLNDKKERTDVRNKRQAEKIVGTIYNTDQAPCCSQVGFIFVFMNLFI